MELITKNKDLVNFIIENSLNFNGSGSGLNGMCVVLAGYALHLGYTNTEGLKEAINEVFPKAVGNYEKELERVFTYADDNNYGKYWKTEDAKLMYKF